MTELLPCSKCRRVPVQGIDGDVECRCGRGIMLCLRDTRDSVRELWNRYHGSPLTLAERPQDVPACGSHRERAKSWDATLREWVPQSSEAMTVGVFTGVRGPITTEYGDEPSVGDGVRVVPSAASCVERWRSCEDALARWSVGACSGGAR